MRALITGANGHIGNHVVRACIAAGVDPIAFVRDTADLRALADLKVERWVGDVLDAESLREACEGCEWVFHLGSPHRNFVVDPAEIVRPAIEGTRNVLAAARAAKVKRVVVTSSAATVGFAHVATRPLDEVSHLAKAESAPTQAKIEAERLAIAEAREGGLDVVVVNPSAVVGPRDYRLTPASRALMGLVQGDSSFQGRCPTDVRDVATAHVLAAQRGKSGCRYLLTGLALTPKEVAEVVALVTGIQPPTMRPPRFLLRLLAGQTERKAAKTGQDAALTRAQLVDTYGKHVVYDSSLARDEIHASFRPAEDTLRDAFRWLLFVGALKPSVARKVARTLGDRAAPDRNWVR